MNIPGHAATLLKDLLGNKSFLTDKDDVWTYGYDNSRKHHAPDAVAIPEKIEQVKPIVQICFDHDIPLTARGRASGTTGGSIPLQGGLILSLERLRQILDFDPANRTMVVEPGVLNESIQKKASQKNLFWGPDPSSGAFCTIGGNLACNAAGPRSIKYGATRDNVLGLKAILGNGQAIASGVQTSKGVVGYDLTRLLIGSEGTLGIITEATLKLIPCPESKQTLCVFYSSIETAVNAIVDVMSSPIMPCALEIIDDKSLELIRHHQEVPFPDNVKAMLLIEVDGHQASLGLEVKTLSSVLRNHGLIELHVARDAHEAKRFWAIRKAISPALRSLSPHKINEDVVVPITQMPAFFERMQLISKQYDIPIVNFGHGGNGNIHVNLLADPLDPIKGVIAHQALSDLFDAVLSFGGTLSGEHGVGVEKRDFVGREIGAYEITLMKQIKTLFDPKGILNPGKLFP